MKRKINSWIERTVDQMPDRIVNHYDKGPSATRIVKMEFLCSWSPHQQDYVGTFYAVTTKTGDVVAKDRWRKFKLVKTTYPKRKNDE